LFSICPGMFAKRYVHPHFSVLESYELTKTNVFEPFVFHFFKIVLAPWF
jgi:hypothetical protein